MSIIDIKIPDIGDFQDVAVIDIICKKDSLVKKEDPLISLESDKATMDIPSPEEGIIRELNIKVGDKVSKGSLILKIETIEDSNEKNKNPKKAEKKIDSSFAKSSKNNINIQCDLLVLGSGPGGYTAAFRASDLGKKVVLVEKYSRIGGVCLNVGCIPSKSLLHAAKVIEENQSFSNNGIFFGEPKIDLTKLRNWKNEIIKNLTGGLENLANKRKVNVLTGLGKFLDKNNICVINSSGEERYVNFENAIIATGSHPIKLPFLPEDNRIFDSTDALEINSIPNNLLIIGGGIIGLEMATVYSALGSKITIVEMMDGLITGADRDIVKPLHKMIEKKCENIWLETSVKKIELSKKGLKVFFKGKNAPDDPKYFDNILSSVGRSPNSSFISVDKAGVNVDEKGFIKTDSQMRTNISNIFAIGDLVGPPMLAHKATHEAKVAAEVICGMKSHFDVRTIPSVAYTDPELAWAGITEEEAKKRGINYGKGKFPWAASGRSLSLGRNEGITKILFDKETNQIIGIGIVGPNAGDLITEGVLAIEMGCDADDLASTIHPHPTLSETVGFAAEAFEGKITDLYIPKKN